MKYYFTLVLIGLASFSSFAQETRVTKSIDTVDLNDPDDPANGLKAPPKGQEAAKENKLSALVAYNFSGGNSKLTNLTPVINYGWAKEWSIKTKKRDNGKVVAGEFKNQNTFTLAINPYVGGQIDTRDSSSYLPGLMLPGVAGIKTDMYWTFKKSDDGFKFIISPANFAFKLVSNFADSSLTIAQHNFRSSIGFGHGDLFLVTAQYTYGWHNGISESEEGYKKAFGKAATDIQYLNISLQTKLSELFGEAPTFLFAEWRGLLNRKTYADFKNSRIISIGIRTDINFRNATPGSSGR